MTDTRARMHPRWTNLAPALVRGGLRAEVSATGEPELWIYDYIDAWAEPEWGGVSASMVLAALREIGDVARLTVRLNSPGGDYFEGVAIYNALVRHSAVVTMYVDALAASAASVIAMAGDRVVMGQGAQMMIHEARTGVYGATATDMRAVARMLDQTNDDIAGFYAGRTGAEVTTWRAAVAAETWYTAAQAVEAGLADEVAPAPARAGAMADALAASADLHTSTGAQEQTSTPAEPPTSAPADVPPPAPAGPIPTDLSGLIRSAVREAAA